MERETDYKKVLYCIDPSQLGNDEWVRVGMAFKEEGGSFEDFDAWSAQDHRKNQYRGTDYTYKRWCSFKNTGSGTVTGGTLVHIAREYGFEPFPKQSGWLDWEDEITADGENEISIYSAPNHAAIPKAKSKAPFQIIDYLESCFDLTDHVNILSDSFKDDDGRYKPKGSGTTAFTAGEYIDMIRDYADDPEWFEKTFGSYEKEAGVWIRVNPIDHVAAQGQRGVSDRMCASYENALIECDTMPIDEQLQKIEELKLPYKALVYSGGKSVHAIVRVDARSVSDYKERVGWLFDYCAKNGFPVDKQNKNPSRLTRLPGCDRAERKQVLIETKRPIPFDDFRRSVEDQSKELEPFETIDFGSILEDMPEKAEILIEDVLRVGHKLIISGPSKAGKSFLFIAMGLAIAEGREWLGHKCRMGKILYVNLEIDERSFYHRVKDVYKALGWEPKHTSNIKIINLRGQMLEFDTIKDRLKKTVESKEFDMVMIDPIYKIMTGDENSASDVRKLANGFDEIGRAGECAMAYIHHYAKGSAAQKSVIDRASGSGVFARDPDAIIALSELYVSDTDKEEIKARSIEAVVDDQLKSTGQWNNLEKIDSKDLRDRVAKQELAFDYFKKAPGKEEFERKLSEAELLGDCPAFRISMVLREFKSPDDQNYFFQYPIHIKDPTGYLETAYLQGDNSIETMNKKKAENTQKRADKKRKWYDEQREKGILLQPCDIADHFGVHKNTIINWADKQPDLKRSNGWILYEDEKSPAKKASRRTKKEAENTENSQ